MTNFAIDRRDRDVAILAIVVIAVFAICLASKGLLTFRLGSYFVNLLLFGYVAVAWLVVRILKILFIDRPEAPSRVIFQTFFKRSLRPRYISVLVILLCLIAFMPLFSAMKSAVPQFSDYSWDGTFINLDRQIHGDDAWRVLQPLVGYPIVTSILSGFYHLWLILLYVGSFYFLLHKQPELRQRFFLSYFLCWSIIGAGLAIAFSSVGPCFVEPIVGRDDFQPLMEYLKYANQQYPVPVLGVQDMLLARYQSADGSLGSGITAMPSMHVAQAFLLFLAMRHISRVAACVSGIFFVIIFVGSVHLAYHYAVDGYLAAIVTAIIWKLSGWWASRQIQDSGLTGGL
jgi:PAP2 superfamily